MQRPPWFLRSRRRLLIAYFGVQALALFPLTIAYAAFFIDHIPSGLALALPFLFTAFLLLLQALFLLPVRRPTLAAEGKSIIATLIVGGFMIAILTVALAMSVYGIVDVYAESLEIDAADDLWLFAALALAAWCTSSILLIMFCRRGTAEHIVQRIASGLFVGTIIEAAAIIPLDLLYRRREECWCGTPTLYGLYLCLTVGIFAFGPLIYLPLLARRRRRRSRHRCEVCGYDMRHATTATRCPECGSGWRPPNVSN